MHDILAISLRAMQADAASLQQVGTNLVNALTPAYRRGIPLQVPSEVGFAAHMEGRRSELSSAAEPAAPTVTVRDPRPGALKATGRALDLALAGPGWFEVSTPQGPAYTREGSFRLDAGGRLVTRHGHPVAGAGGDVTLPLADLRISADARIFKPGAGDDVPLAQLKVVVIGDDASAQAVTGEDGLLRVPGPVREAGPEARQVRQGFLEQSNVSSAQEMTLLLRSLRHFETMQKVAQAGDDMLGTAIRRLGES